MLVRSYSYIVLCSSSYQQSVYLTCVTKMHPLKLLWIFQILKIMILHLKLDLKCAVV